MVFILALMGCNTDNGVNLIRKPPVALITAPADGDLIVLADQTVTLEGAVSDLPDAADTLSILWSVDDLPIDSFGANVSGDVVAGWDLTGTSPGTHEVALSVTDSDANTTTVRVTVELVAPSTPPVVEITAPADGSTYLPGDSITFTGQATDANDPAESLVFAWTSSIDGVLGGASSGGGLSFVTTAGLSEGSHTIVLSATDLDGDVGTDTIVVDVGEAPDPPIDDPEPGEVIFSELMINPDAVDDEVGEWVELYNTGGRTLDIGGYSFHDLDYDQYTLQGSIRVDPYGYAVLCADLSPSVNGGADCDGYFLRLTSGALALANAPDEVVLTRTDGVEIDRLEYGDDWVESGAAIGLDPTHLTPADNDDFANWCFQTGAMSGGDLGTPGEENDPCP